MRRCAYVLSGKCLPIWGGSRQLECSLKTNCCHLGRRGLQWEGWEGREALVKFRIRPPLHSCTRPKQPPYPMGWIHNSPFTTRLFITFNKNSRCTTTIHLTAHGSRSRSRFTSRLTITFTTKFSTFSSFSFGGILKWNPPNLRIFYPFSLVTVALAQLISTLVCFLGTPLFPPSHSQCGRHCPHTFCCLSATRPLIANRILFGMTIDKRCMICFFFGNRRSSIQWLIT